MAQATPTGSIGFSAIGGASADSTNLNTATTVTITNPFVTAGSGQGDLSGIAANTPVTISDTTYTVTALGALTPITAFTLDVAGNTFTFDEQEVTVNQTSGSPAHATLTIAFIGSVTGPDITGGTDTASATYTFNQTGVGGAISFAGTAAHPAQPVTVPEPMGLAALGVGLLGLGFVRRHFT